MQQSPALTPYIWHGIHYKIFSNEQYCLVSPSVYHVNPLLGQKCFGINDLFVLTWINWLYGRYLRLQGFSSLQNLKSRQYEHLPKADNFLKAMASVQPVPFTSTSHWSWCWCMTFVCPPTVLAQPTDVAQDVLMPSKENVPSYFMKMRTTKSAWCSDLMYCLLAIFFFLLCTAKHEFYKY